LTEIMITGVAGELGGSVAKLALDMGFKVRGNDVIREKEAWRFGWLGIADQIDYLWKATQDLVPRDLKDTDVILDCGCYADRPLGETSPRTVLENNITAPQHLLEMVRNMRVQPQPLLIYPSSFVIFFGVLPGTSITETTNPAPKGVYALSKYYAEELYRCYYQTYGVPTIITRVGSCFGPGGRSDQFIHRIIIEMLQGRDVSVISPYAGRAYTYAADALDFYRLLLENMPTEPLTSPPAHRLVGVTLHDAGCKENKPYLNMDIAEKVRELTGHPTEPITDSRYESTEQVYDPSRKHMVPVVQHTDWENSLAHAVLGWKPKHTIEEGLKETIDWFKENLDRYI